MLDINALKASAPEEPKQMQVYLDLEGQPPKLVECYEDSKKKHLAMCKFLSYYLDIDADNLKVVYVDNKEEAHIILCCRQATRGNLIIKSILPEEADILYCNTYSVELPFTAE